jgi:uncharacterized protein YdaU (DUF1376 family)
VTKKADTWMPWYVADYLADTAHLTTEQHGAYCLMLMAAWKAGGSLPNHDGQLAAVCRLSAVKWKASKPILLAFFGVDGDRIVHKRVTAERAKAQAISEKKAQNGKGGAAKRWQTDGGRDGKPMANATTDASQEGWQTDAPSPSPSPSPAESSEAKASGADAPGGQSPEEIIFGYGVPLLVNAGTPEKQARSFLGKLRSGYEDAQIVEALRNCIKAKAVQPLEYLAKALPPKDAPKKVAWHETNAGVEAMGVKLGLGMWDEPGWKSRGFRQEDSFAAYKARVVNAAGLKQEKEAA